MNNDELVTRRAQAIAEDRCFSKGRLRDEFRMKPAPGAEPVKWYKNTYGGRFAVYRIADCVPMREKRPLTSKQLLAGQRLSVLSRLNSTSGRMARQAYDWLSLAPLFLDTETTGLDNTAEALEIGLTDATGQVVFETRLKPTVAIGAQAAAVHGISEQALCGAPSWTDVARQLRHAIGDRPVIIFNARFDIRILKQTAAAHSDPADWLEELTVYCAMELAAGYYGGPPGIRKINHVKTAFYPNDFQESPRWRDNSGFGVLNRTILYILTRECTEVSQTVIGRSEHFVQPLRSVS
ncbi:3'-5' exonuclease [Escherichia coli]|uniref:3'-5' exonuclease n=2 Tax=Escherichia coli TaxID=562 RepID=UPI001776F97F|nr:3'-5' exonuclease [Escherichia coli]EFA6392915.1 3'-5' exonuclease [Escherichia coli]EFI1992708.1 3'-5' exonuclease [Escherichia coli]EIQ2070991.1 3'-5' exonuclease [Escherichia coli]EIQ2075167.1 3'-5' exonuclease [Escherichia coli]EKD5324993.1 3'-5' exonuclease [Escherichia coli]